MTYQDIILRLKGIYGHGEAKAMARIVLEDCFGMTMTDVLCGKTDQLTTEQQRQLESIVTRLEKNEPLQYVLGYADFYSYRFCVAPGVLIPRPETEELVEKVIAEACKHDCPRILDIGTGSGCIAITTALELKKKGRTFDVEAWDISGEALDIARKNAEMTGAKVNFRMEDVLCGQLDNKKRDIIVSNPPYICESEKSEMERNVIDHEPHLALFVPDSDPLLFYRRIAQYAAETLNHNGTLLYEINRAYGKETCSLLTDMGFSNVTLIEDSFSNPRIITATKP